MSGFALASMSAVLNGSFVVFSKLPSVKKAGVDPLVFQLWTSLGVFLSSLITMPFFSGEKYPPEAIGWGILAGGLFVCAVAFSFVAVQLVGLSIGQGIWSGSAVLVAFVWGVAAFGDEVKAGVAGGGLALIVLGVIGIAMCADIAARLGGEAVRDSTGDEFDAAFLRERGVRSSSISSTMGGAADLHSHLLEDGTITPAHRVRTGLSVDLDPRLMHPVMQQQQQLNGSSMSLPAPPLLADPLASLHQQQERMRGGSAYGMESHDMIEGGGGNQHHANTNGNGNGWGSRQSSMYDSPISTGAGGNGGDYSPTPSLTLSSAAYLAASTKLTAQRQLYGSICAMITGVFGGSILMPLQLAPSHVRGLSFVPSFGLGTLLVAPLITLPYMWLSRSSPSRGHWAVRESLLPGLAAGFVWNGANVCSIYAISDLGYAVAYPLMQCAIAVAALWGVLVFKEIRGRQIGVMAVSAFVVLGGAVLLALSKK